MAFSLQMCVHYGIKYHINRLVNFDIEFSKYVNDFFACRRIKQSQSLLLPLQPLLLLHHFPGLVPRAILILTFVTGLDQERCVRDVDVRLYHERSEQVK